MGCPCVPEVIAHETLDALTWLGARISQHVGRSLLHLMTQGVLIPSGIQVQRRTHSQKEILGLIDACRIGRSPAQEQRIGQHRDRARGSQIAERSVPLSHPAPADRALR